MLVFSVSLHSSFPAGVDMRRRCLKFCLLENKYDVRASQSTNKKFQAWLVTLYEEILSQSLGKH